MEIQRINVAGFYGFNMFTDEVKALPLISDVLNQRIDCMQVIQHLRNLIVIVPIIKALY